MASDFQEIEVKFQIVCPKQVGDVIDILQKNGLCFQAKTTQNDTYWDTEQCEIINLKRGLRSRSASGKVVALEFKSLFKRADGTSFIEEIPLFKDNSIDVGGLREILVNRLGVLSEASFSLDNSNNNNVKSFLSGLGLKSKVEISKTRYSFVNNSSEVSIDNVVGLPLHLEIELSENGNYVDYQKLINRFMNDSALVLQPVEKSYIDLLFQANNNFLSPEEFEQKFQEDFSWNVLPNERQLVESLLGNYA